jgi:hypothetical protein
MGTRLRATARGYANRRAPWGPPWWVYAAAIATANVIRQLVMPGDVSTEAQVATFVGLVVGVSAVVTLVHVGLTRRRRSRVETDPFLEPPR